MSKIAENLRATILSLKQIGDKLKLLISTSVTKSEAESNKQDIISAIDNIDTSDLAKQGLDSGVSLTTISQDIVDAVSVLKNSLQGPTSSATLSYLYDELGDLGALLDEINGEEMPIEFATDYARQGSDSGATNTAILNAVVSSVVPQINIPDTGSATTQEIAANTLYVFSNRTSDLTLTLGAEVHGQTSEYHFIIEVGNTLPNITLPSGLTWKSNVSIEFIPNKTFEVSILNNYGIFVIW